METTKTVENYAALLSLTEMGLGGLLHAFFIPFSGHFLSLNQILIMSHATDTGKTAPYRVAMIAAMMKSLSPMGKRLTPMIAISMQGLLFNLGVIVFGTNPVGRILGGLFSASWAFVQHFVLYFFLFGNCLYEALIKTGFGYLLILGIVVKIFLGMAVALWAPKISLEGVEKFFKKFPAREKRERSLWKELLNPTFLFYLILTVFFFLWIEGPNAKLVWIILRPISFGLIAYYLIRLTPSLIFSVPKPS